MAVKSFEVTATAPVHWILLSQGWQLGLSDDVLLTRAFEALSSLLDV